MTDREKLVELLMDKPFGRATEEEETEHIEDVADYLIANGVTVQSDKDINVPNKWISVKDRLPEDDLPNDTKKKMIRCLVYTDKGTIKPCVRQRWQHFDGQLVPWQWNKDIYAKPTHWMYYPQPPKGE